MPGVIAASSSTAARTARIELKSLMTACIDPGPVTASDSATSCPALAEERPTMTTCAPWRRRSRAVAAPMPLVPPVTTAVRPAKRAGAVMVVSLSAVD